MWGTKNNPTRMGLSGYQREREVIPAVLRKLGSHPGIRRQFTTVGRCKQCWAKKGRGSRTPRMLNGQGLCLRHAWMLQEGLLGVVVSWSNSSMAKTFQRRDQR